MELFWHRALAEQWRRQLAQVRTPHAVMLLGARGTGKRCAAAWLAQSVLTGGAAASLPRYPCDLPGHPDLYWLTVPEDKRTIGVDRIRALSSGLSLTSHGGRGKVAVIDPADALTASAANSLLKTLEEPPGATTLILVVDRDGRLPATIVSRCQRLAVPLPAATDALAWLERLQPGAAWAAALREAGGAPLAAIAALERLETTEVMARELAAVAARQASPLDVAERWAALEPNAVLDWLGWQVRRCIRRRHAGGTADTRAVLADSVLRRMDSRNLFCYLDVIDRLRGQPAGSFNVQLTFETLLIHWAEGLDRLRRQAGPGV